MLKRWLGNLPCRPQGFYRAKGPTILSPARKTISCRIFTIHKSVIANQLEKRYFSSTSQLLGRGPGQKTKEQLKRASISPPSLKRLVDTFLNPYTVPYRSTLEKSRTALVRQARSALVQALNNGEPVPIGPIRNGRFELYSTEYHDKHYSGPAHPPNQIRFGNIYDEEPVASLLPEGICVPGQIAAELHIYPEGHLDFRPFDEPKQASLEPVRTRSIGWPEDGEVEMEVTFLGDGCLMMKMCVAALLEKKRQKKFGETMVEFFGAYVSDEKVEMEREKCEEIKRQRNGKN